MRNDSTLSFFSQKNPDNIENVMPVVPASKNQPTIEGHVWQLSEEPTSWNEFTTEFIQSSSDDTVFFLDSSFIHRHEIPVEVFNSMLERKIVFTSYIWGELQDWLAKPFSNIFFRDVLLDARENGNSSIVFLEQESWPDEIRSTLNYYVSLLAARKYIGVDIRQNHTQQNDCELTKENLRSLLQSRLGDRGAKLAEKGLEDHMKTNFTADEDLVVSAVTHAVLSGCESVILTRDRDIIEQFRRLIYLLDTHYRCMLIAESYVENPGNVIEIPGSSEAVAESPDDCVELRDRCMLHLPRRFTDWLLRKHSGLSNVACHRLAGPDSSMKYARLQFSFQRNVKKLLEIKGETEGRNCVCLGGRNCHLAVSPPFVREVGGKAIIGYDRSITLGPFTGPRVDLEYAIREVQRFSMHGVDITLQNAPIETLGLKLADFHLPVRLAFAAEPQWQNISWEELSKAIRFYDNAASFLVDREVLLPLPKGVRQELTGRGFLWSCPVRDITLATDAFKNLSGAERTALEKMAYFDPRKMAQKNGGLAYYLALMALRKQFGESIRIRVRKDYGRKCKAGEIGEIAEHYGGKRARRLAEYGENNKNDPLLFSGDQLLVSGLIHAIDVGTDVVFVTRDPLFLDQFEKLMTLVSDDYVACEYGRRFGCDHSAFKNLSTEKGVENPNTAAFGAMARSNLPVDWHKGILVRDPYLLNLHCWLLGRSTDSSARLSAMTFCGERAMHNLLRIKSDTAGRNVEGLGGGNIRAATRGTSEEEGILTFCQDRMIQRGSADFPRDDRLDLSISSVAAADILRTHTNMYDIDILKYNP